MSFEPADLTVAELKRLLGDDDASVSRQVVTKLRRDPRRGARELGRRLERRLDEERDARRHLESMLHFERILWTSGLRRLAGVDEAGMGPLAGPVVAAAVVFPPDTLIDGIDDSKRLEAEERERLVAVIQEHADDVALGVVEVAEIDELNVYRAGLLAMRRAVEALPEPPEHVLVDAREIPGVDLPQNRFDKGDGLNFSIAAASIVAKTHRDAVMADLDRRWPAYGFARHKGYATAEHREAIRRHGPSPIHRRSFDAVRELCGEASDLFYELSAAIDETGTVEELRAVDARIDEVADGLEEGERRRLRTLAGRRWRAIG